MRKENDSRLTSSSRLHGMHQSLSSPLSDPLKRHATQLALRPSTRAGVGDVAGDTRLTANVLLSTPGTQTFTDTVGTNDPDFYKFTVPNAQGKGRLVARNLSNATLFATVLNDKGTILAVRSVFPGKAFDESYPNRLGSLRPGTYYIKLDALSGVNKKYTFKLTIER